MKTDNRNPYEEGMKIIDLTPTVGVDTSLQKETENPVIIIEHDGLEEEVTTIKKSKFRLWQKVALFMILLFAVLATCLLGWNYYRHNYYVGISISCSPNENIEKLKAVCSKVTTEVFSTQDTIGTVPVNIYTLKGLKASIQTTMPDSLDASVYFYTRCADYGKRGEVLGSMVIDGKRISKDNSRLGYCAMVGNNVVIGIAKNDKIREFCEDNKGSYFRQFILVSNSEIPKTFHLHGVEMRRALARIDNQLYFVESQKKETMWDFADALRKYGFIDAIYITGGGIPNYHRTSNGEIHKNGNWSVLPIVQRDKNIKWLVFRKC